MFFAMHVMVDLTHFEQNSGDGSSVVSDPKSYFEKTVKMSTAKLSLDRHSDQRVANLGVVC